MTTEPTKPAVVVPRAFPYSFGDKSLSQGRCEATLTERFYNSRCACSTYQGNLGPCKTYEEGPNGRCAYCDHEAGCHQQILEATA